MKKTIIYLGIFFLSIITISCGKKNKLYLWGETEFYEKFLIWSYEPVIMENTITLDFNEDALRLIPENAEITFEVVEFKEGKECVPNGISVYKNKKMCSGHTIMITPAEKEVVIGVEFGSEAEEGYHTLFLKMRPNQYIDRIEYSEFGNGFVVKKNNIMNPVLSHSLWTFGILLLLLIIWLILSRTVFWPSTKFSKVYIDYNDGGGEHIIRMNGAYQMVCTNNTKTKISLLSRIFKGPQKIEINDFWEHPVIIKSGTRKNVIWIYPKTHYTHYTIDGELKRREEIKIGKNDKQEITIYTN